VISYVDSELRYRRRAPAEAEEWVTRLEAELRQHLQHAAPAWTEPRPPDWLR
jgi:hypothetical protein